MKPDEHLMRAMFGKRSIAGGLPAGTGLSRLTVSYAAQTQTDSSSSPRLAPG
jgi:hypothetical protein